MRYQLLLLAAAAALLCSCANAFQDLHDGQGMRGWAGVPLKDTIPLGIAMAEQQAALANERAARIIANGSRYQPNYIQPIQYNVQPVQIPSYHPAPLIPVSRY